MNSNKRLAAGLLIAGLGGLAGFVVLDANDTAPAYRPAVAAAPLVAQARVPAGAGRDVLPPDLSETAPPTNDPQELAARLRAWATRDLPGAFRWARMQAALSAEADSGLDSPVEIVLRAAAQHGPRDIAALFVAGEFAGSASEATEQLTEQALAALLEQGHIAVARELLAACASGRVAASCGAASFERVATALAAGSPAEAVAWLKTLPASVGRDHGFAAAIVAWADTAPAVALSAATQLGGAAGEQALGAGLLRWTERDLVAATAWLAAHEAEPSIDRYILQLLEHSALVERSPRASVAWAEVLRDPPMRSRALDHALTAWAREDRAAALRYVEHTAFLGAAEKHALRARLGPE